jgi:hypothetical protein
VPARRFPPPWSVEEQAACFVVRDHNGQNFAVNRLQVSRDGTETLLRSNAFHNEHKALSGAVPERLNRLVRWRILPSDSLLDAIKCDHHETPFRSVTFEWRDFAATNQVLTLKGSQCARYRCPIFLECGWVINFKFSDDIAGATLTCSARIALPPATPIMISVDLDFARPDAARLRQPAKPRASIILRYAPILDWTLLSLFAVDCVAKPFK